MNMLRRSVCAALSNQGFIMRQILVEDGHKIAVIITMPEQNVKKEAERIKMNKEVEFGIADLLSLEPLDRKGRPLRLNAYLHNEYLWNNEYSGIKGKGSSSRELRHQIQDLLAKDCNMKKIIRIAGAIWTDPAVQDHESIYDHDKVTIEAWEQYAHYLLELSTHMKSIELISKKVSYITKSYYGTSRIVTRGNRSRKSIDDIEMSRLVNRLSVRAFKLCIEKKDLLNNLWDKLGTVPLKYSFQYHAVNNHMRPSTKVFYERVWADYNFTYPHNPFEFTELNGNVPSKQQQYLGQFERSNSFRDKNEVVQPELHHCSFSKSERLKVCYTLVIYCLLRSTALSI